MLAPATRYCPDCLSGDGSAIQESLGGPWLKAWHLPVVFACPAHQHYFAPRPIEAAQPPEIQEAWKARRNNILHLIRRDRPSPHYTNVRTEFNTLATSLARSIDSLTDSPILSPAPDRSPRRAIA